MMVKVKHAMIWHPLPLHHSVEMHFAPLSIVDRAKNDNVYVIHFMMTNSLWTN